MCVQRRANTNTNCTLNFHIKYFVSIILYAINLCYMGHTKRFFACLVDETQVRADYSAMMSTQVTLVNRLAQLFVVEGVLSNITLLIPYRVYNFIL